MHRRFRLGVAMLALFAASCFWAVPRIAKAPPPAVLISSDMRSLTAWAKQTDPQSVFHFPDAGRDLHPGVFRAESVRALYVDWKSGGQVNFQKGLANQWWQRWSATLAKPYVMQPPGAYRGLPADFIVLRTRNRLPDARSVYENGSFVVYTTR